MRTPLLTTLAALAASTLGHAQEADPDEAQPVATAPVVAPPSGATVLGPAHGADLAPRVRRDPEWDVYGDLRLRAEGGTNTEVDPEGTLADETWWLSSRVIAGFDWRPTEQVTVLAEIEALNGRLAGTSPTLGATYDADAFRVPRSTGTHLDRLLPRRLGVQVLSPKAGLFRIGAELFTWGTGLLANDGAGDPDFGDANTGSIVARAAYAAGPWRFKEGANPFARGTVFFLSGDVVIRDETASLWDGDLAVQGVVGWRTSSPIVDVGAFGVGRWQRDREDPRDPRPDRTTVVAFPVDVYGKVLLTPPRWTTQRLLLETEAVLIHGRTDRAYLEEALTGGSRVQSFGAVARLRYDHETLRITAKLEAGVASGDNDGRDDVVRTFAFHSDYNVGMLLFDHVLPRVTARTLDQIADPELTAVPSPGGRYTVNQGAVSNAVYLNPVLRYRPIPAIDLRLGYLAAWSAGAFVDVYETNIRGGYNTTPGGVVGGGTFYGHEVDAAVRGDIPVPGRLMVSLGVEGAVLLPGDAFDGIAGERMSTQALGRGRVNLTF